MKNLKRILAVLLTLCILTASGFTAVTSAASADTPVNYVGDIDEDGMVTVSDVVALRSLILEANFSAEQAVTCDLDYDNNVTVSDVIRLRELIMSGIIEERPSAEAVTAGTTYVIRNLNSSKALSVRNSSTDTGSSMYQYDYAATASQQWTVVASDSEGYYGLISAATGLALTVDSAYEAGAKVYQDTYSGADNQLFSFTTTSDGYYTISPKNGDSYVLDVADGSTNSGARVQLYSSNLTGAQKWYTAAVEISASAPSAELADQAFYDFINAFATKDGKGGLYFSNSNYFWDYAEMMEVLLDKYERDGTESDLDMIRDFYKGFVNQFGTDWTWNNYNDDIMWMVIFCSRAYQITGDETFKTEAKTHFDAVYKRAYTTDMGGGLYWKKNTIATKNACINGPAAIAASYLYQILDDTTYLNYAKSLMDWEINTLFDKDTGAVYDNIYFTDLTFETFDTAVDKTVYSYNQGTFIGAATMLYELTGDQNYITYAKKAADYTKNVMYKNGVLNNENSGDDGPGFKGIFARWLGYYINSTGDSDYNSWLAKNLTVGWNNRNSSGLVSTKWGTRTSESISERPFSYSTYVALAQAYPYGSDN